ncbi:MAG: UvrD-helicase domain-containing protein [Microscillaceae bacterium]
MRDWQFLPNFRFGGKKYALLYGMQHQNFKIYSSSAGSGKTYTLTREYIKLTLLQEDPHYFRHILAITFTNDAANEMKARIVEALRSLAFPTLLSQKEVQKRHILLQSLSEETGLPPQKLQKRAENIFHKIIYNYTDFAVSTIDSFVNKIVSAFTRELEIPYNFEIDLDTDALLQNAVDRLLEKVGRQDRHALSDFILDWVNEKTIEGKNWSRIGADLAKFAQNLLNEGAYAYLDELRTLQLADFRHLQHQMAAHKNETARQIVHLAREATQRIAREDLDSKNFFQGDRGVYAYLHRLAHEYDPHKPANSFVRQTLNENKWHAGKTIAPGLAAIQDELQALLLQIENCRQQADPLGRLIDLVQPHLYELALIQEIEAEMANLKKENSAIHISDSNKKIAEIIAQEPVPYIYERVGEKYFHILIDEFQDTSVLQWQNLLPLVENNLASARFNLLVGDAKQAIYAWRGGEMEQLVYLYQNKPEKLLTQYGASNPLLAERYETLRQHHWPAQLNTNYRSAAEIVQFNNAFFTSIVQSDFGKQYPLLGEIYDEKFPQQVPGVMPRRGGHVAVHWVEAGPDYKTQACHSVLALIEEMLALGYRKRDIAILTRKNHEGKDIAVFLKKQGLEVLSQISLLLIADEKVRFILALLKVIHKPDDKIAKTEALYLFYLLVKGQSPDPATNEAIREVVNQPIWAFYDTFRQAGFGYHFGRLQMLTLYELVEKIIEVFQLLASGQRLEYIFRLLDVILEFKRQKNSSLEEFIAYWEDKKDSLSINTPKDLDAIQVTSIHKSKGLEYPVVIVPFADWSFEPKAGSTMWARLPEEPAALWKIPNSEHQLRVALVNIKKEIADTPLAEAFHQMMQKTFLENINMLYVAFTRPTDRLYVIPKKEDFDKARGQKGVHFLLFRYLLEVGLWQETQTEYVLSKGDPSPLGTPPTEAEEEVFLIEEFVSTDIHKKIKLRTSKSRKKKNAPSS